MRIDEFMEHLKALPRVYSCEKCPFNAHDPEKDKYIVCSLRGRICLATIMDNPENLTQIEGVLQLEEYFQENEWKNVILKDKKNKLKNSEV